jgi:hypothetical protein
MANTLSKNCGCPSPEIVAIPGLPGAAGAAGSSGTDGANSFSILTTANFTVPAQAADTINLTFDNNQWMIVGQNVFVTGAGYFSVKSKTGNTQAILTYLSYTGNNQAGNTISAGVQVSPAGTQPTITFPIGISQGGTGVATKAAAIAALGLGQTGTVVNLEAIGLALAGTGAYVSVATTITGMALTAPAAGLYLILARCSLDFTGVTYAASQVITVQVQRTNNTVRTLAVTYRASGILTTETVPTVDIVVPFFVSSLALNDILALQILTTALTGAGSITVNSASLAIIPLSLT